MMNKLIIKEDIIKEQILDDSISVSFIKKDNIFSVNKIKIDVLKNSKLEIFHDTYEDIKMDIKIYIHDDCKLELTEYKTGTNYKISNLYEVMNNSKLILKKYYKLRAIKEFTVIDLNGINACVNYDFNTICKNFQKYDMNINHNNKNTISNIKNSGLNIIDGTLTFNISSFVKADNCKIKENNLIVNKTLEKCIITPNIFVDNYKVESNICTNITNDENKLLNTFYKKIE